VVCDRHIGYTFGNTESANQLSADQLVEMALLVVNLFLDEGQGSYFAASFYVEEFRFCHHGGGPGG
jgi:hypothetical protein